MNDMPDQISLRGLGYREDGEWVALALEMDLRGYGKTFREAMDDLRDLVLMQLSFAREKSDTSLIFKAAEKKYFDIYDKNRQAVLLEMASGRSASKKRKSLIGDLALPDLLNNNDKRNTSWADAAA